MGLARALAATLLLGAFAASATRAESPEAAWRALAADGAVALIRHARAPGPSPDPPGFRLEDCATQRNLSAEGRAQAERIGAAWRANKVKLGKLLTSPWCRARDTARLMGLGEPEIETALWNFLHPPPDRDAKMARLRTLIREWRGPGALVMVAHGVTLRALGVEDPGEGGIMVVMPDPAAPEGYRRIGAISPP